MALTQDCKETTVTLANAIELTSQIIMGVAGNSVGNTINGQSIDPITLKSMVAARFKQNLSKFINDGV